jgi:hypothetical protein
MGDTGSLTMGYLLAFFAIKLTTIGKPMFVGSSSGDYLIYAVSVILIPVMDVFRVFFARIRDAKSPFFPDKRHIHHKIMALGFTMRQTRYIIFAISLFFIAMNMTITGVLKWNINILLIVDAFVWIVMNMLISNRVHHLRSINDPTALRFTDIGSNYKIKRRRRN